MLPYRNYDRRLQPSHHGLILTDWFDKSCQALTADRALVQLVFNTLVAWKQKGFQYIGEPLDGSEVVHPTSRRPTNCRVVAAIESKAAADHLLDRLKSGWRTINT